ncbi:MAG: aldo/keto reductase [Rhodospirillales bacterium]|jgi:aryl-alcohol dehydrogenase-like predicted oxidoreductase|nr:aldo/keto reductase [Rhodospirillales bacterium]
METVKLAGIDREASRIGLGTWALGGWMWGGADDDASMRTLLAAIDKGVNLIDTAPVYGFGRSEELVGRTLAEAGLRDQVVLSTKAGIDWRGETPFRNASRARIEREVEDSLKRLRTEWIDIYFVHWPDPLTPCSETAAAMHNLLKAGKIRSIGVSNFSPAQMDAMRELSPLHVAQPPYNLFERGIEADVLPYCRENGVATLTYGAICRGLLSGRMTAETAFEKGDLRRVDPKFRVPRYRQYLAAVARLDELAQQRFGKRVIHLALRWVLDQPGVSVALWGARTAGQLSPIDGALGWSLDAATLAEIERIVAEEVSDPVGPEFMAPPDRAHAAA